MRTLNYVAETVFPSGILGGDTTWLADHRRGELLEISLQGKVLHTFKGLEGPMGMAKAPNGDICVAEMLGGRIRCFSLVVLRGP